MQTADDVDILNVARNSDRICITLDHDFHTHLALTRSGLPSVVLLRVRVSMGLVRQRSSACVQTHYRRGLLFQLMVIRSHPPPTS
jgi:predicted nuclease of predicted toxin-antitoxin system